MAFSIRKLESDDWQVYRTIRLRALQTDPGVFGSNYQKEIAMPDFEWQNRLENSDCAVFIVYEDETAVGMTGIVVDGEDKTGKSAKLWGSWLEPHVRGKGLSVMMYEARIDWAKQHPDIEKIIVGHRASNLSSKNANQKHGFIFTHETQVTWPDGTEDGFLHYMLPTKPSP